MSINTSEYMGAYIDGSSENLDTMDKMLLALEQNPENNNALEEIFRAAHTLKGMAATMGFEDVTSLTHVMEDVLDKFRTKKIAVTPKVIDLLFETFDVLRTLVNDSIEDKKSVTSIDDIVSRLNQLQSKNDSNTNQKNTSGSNSAKSDLISDFKLSEYDFTKIDNALADNLRICILDLLLINDCLLKGPRVFMVVRALEESNCEIIKAVPDIKELENENFDRSFKIIFSTTSRIDSIKDSIENISEIESVTIQDISEIDLGDLAQSNETVNQQHEQPVLSTPPEPSTTPIPPTLPVPPAPSAPAPSKPPSAPASSHIKMSASNQQVDDLPPVSLQRRPEPDRLPENNQQQSLSSPSQPPTGDIWGQPLGAMSEIDQDSDDESEEKEQVNMVQLVTFKLCGETYALEISQVDAIINLKQVTRVPAAPEYIDGVINLRGEIVPVINTRRRLNLENSDHGKLVQQIIILTFEEEKVKAGVLVDRVYEVVRLPETSIDAPERVSDGVDIQYLKGVGKIDKKIIILLNARRIVFADRKLK